MLLWRLVSFGSVLKIDCWLIVVWGWVQVSCFEKPSTILDYWAELLPFSCSHGVLCSALGALPILCTWNWSSLACFGLDGLLRSVSNLFCKMLSISQSSPQRILVNLLQVPSLKKWFFNAVGVLVCVFFLKKNKTKQQKNTQNPENTTWLQHIWFLPFCVFVPFILYCLVLFCSWAVLYKEILPSRNEKSLWRSE